MGLGFGVSCLSYYDASFSLLSFCPFHLFSLHSNTQHNKNYAALSPQPFAMRSHSIYASFWKRRQTAARIHLCGGDAVRSGAGKVNVGPRIVVVYTGHW